MSAYPERRKGKLTGAWIAEVTGGGDRRRKRFPTKLEAERWADFVKLTGSTPPEETKADNGPTFGQVVLEARATKHSWQRGRDPSGLRRVEYASDFIGRDTPICAVDTLALDTLVADLKKRPGRTGKVTPGTINRYLSAASAVLTFAHERGYIPGVPTVPWQREGGKRLHWLTEEGEEAVCSVMLTANDYPSALTTRVLAATGMRWGEYETLEPEQVDLRDPEQAWVRLWETKTDDPRSIPVDGELARQLKALVANKQRPNYYTYRKRLATALKSAGQSPSLTIHCLRHTTATRLVQKGVALPVVQKFLGHKAIQTTMRYVKVADADLTAAAKKLSPQEGQNYPLTSSLEIVKARSA